MIKHKKIAHGEFHLEWQNNVCHTELTDCEEPVKHISKGEMVSTQW